MRYSGQIAPYYPPTAPLELRLPADVYDSAPTGVTSTGPGISTTRQPWGSGSFVAPVGRTPMPPGVPYWVRSGYPGLSGDCACSGGVSKLSILIGAAAGAVVGTMTDGKAVRGAAIGAAVAGLATFLDNRAKG